MLDVIKNIAVIIYSPKSEPLKTQRINITFEVNALILIYINVSMFTQIIHDPASSTEEMSKKNVYESLQIAFPNMC